MDFLEPLVQAVKTVDAAIMLFVQNNIQCPFLDVIMPWITLLGNGGILWLLLGLLLIISKKYRKYGIALVFAVAVTAFVGNIVIKPLVERLRPFIENPEIMLIIPAPKGYSFPSGHSASSFAAATVLIFVKKKWAVVGFLLAVLIAFSRVYLFVHYPSDITVGFFMGIAFGLLTVWGMKKVESRHLFKIGQTEKKL